MEVINFIKDLLTPFKPYVGVIVGATVGGILTFVTSYITTRSNHKQQKALMKSNHKHQEVLSKSNNEQQKALARSNHKHQEALINSNNEHQEALSKSNHEQHEVSKKRELHRLKLEELHQLLTEVTFRIYGDNFEILNMIKQNASFQDISLFVVSQTGVGKDKAIAILSRAKTLAQIYAHELKTDMGEKAAEVFRIQISYGNKHKDMTHTPDDLAEFKNSLEEFRLSANKHIENVTKYILDFIHNSETK